MDELQTPPPPEAKLHFLDYWRIIRIRKTVILAVFLLVVITATIVTFVFLPEAFSSMARIEVQRDVTDVSGVQGNGGGQAAMSMYDPYFIQTEFEIIQSSLVLDQVVKDLDLTRVWARKYNIEGVLKVSECRQRLKRMIDLRPTRNTSLLEIRVYSDNKDEAAAIAEKVAEDYKAHRESERQELTDNGIAAFKTKLADYDLQISNQVIEVDLLRKKLGVVDSDPQNSGSSPTLDPMSLMHYQSLKIEKEAAYIQENEQLNKLLEITNLADLRQTLPTLAPDPLLQELLQKLVDAQTQLVTVQSSLGPEHPDVLRLKDLVAELNHQIDGRVRGIITALGDRVASLLAVIKDCEAKVNDAKTNDMIVAENSRPYFKAKADLERLKKISEIIAIRSDQESIERALPKTMMVTIVDKAEVEPAPVRPKKVLNIALGVVIGLVVGVGLAFFIEYLDTSVKTIDDVERTLQTAVLGVIPQNVGYLIEEGAESPHAEAYRVLRTNLLFSRKDDKLNTVAVVSAGAGEGKSTTVFNLATVFAQCGQRVLVVDSDLRRPTLHKLLNVANTLGLTNYLLKQNKLEEVIQTTPLANLDFLSSGKLPSSSLGILSSAQMKELITELKARYDFVFFDSPPIMGVSDASILASEVDMTLQVIQYRRYPQPMNIRAKQLIEKVGGNLIGIVLNNINMSQDESYYYYSGYYHDYYSEERGRGRAPRQRGG